jgi:dihydrofolate reductase
MSSQESTHTEEPTARPPRRKVVAYQLLSLDGVAEDPDRFISVWEDAADAHLAEVIASQDAVILGRRSHDVWAEFWPGSEIEPFASFINAVPKYVATSTPLTKDWANAEAIEGGLVDFVHRLRRRPGGDIGVHASISVTRALLAADLVDELSLVVAPATAATGRRLFDGLPPMRLELVRGVASPGGHLLADYRVVRRPAATS